MTEVELLLALYHNPHTREVALKMAEDMRKAASKPTTPQVNTNRKAAA